jgi:disulfide bond formation protein DsbB
VQWSLFGISLAGWNFLCSTIGAAAIFALLGQRDGAGARA